jgi:small subunit ribosomal protein S20
MPIIKSAKKALRQTKKRTALNRTKKMAFKSALKEFKKKKDPKAVTLIYSLVDKMAKAGVVHKNRAARIKSYLAQQISQTSTSKPVQAKNKK